MECLINKNGDLIVFRNGKEIPQMCPFNTRPCGHSCPHFTEVEQDDPDDKETLWLSCTGISDGDIGMFEVLHDERKQPN